MQDYLYRKEFGLSYKDFLDEPLDEYSINAFIMTKIAEIQSKEAKRK